jgi:hypothetical protein
LLVIRKIFIVIALFGLISSAQAQVRQKRRHTIQTQNMPKYDRRLFHFGINLGMLMCGTAIRPIDDLRSLPDTIYAVNPVWQPGFSMGIESNLRLAEHWDLRLTPTLSLASKVFEYDTPNGRKRFELPTTLIEFPLYIKFKSARLNNWRAYVIGGAKYVFDLSNKIGAENASEYPIKLKPHDVTAEVGFGMDFYLPYFKFSTQVKASWGLVNLKYTENNIYNSAIDQVNSRSVYISFLFE